MIRSLEGNVGPLNLASSLESLGQALFAPPSVKGWDGGPTWLNGQTLLFRQNLALALTTTEDGRFGRRCDPATLLKKHGTAGDDAAAVDFLLNLFLQNDVPAETRTRLLSYLPQARKAKHPAFVSGTDAADGRLRSLTHLVLTLPEYQLD